ncbi:MAG TPA: DsrE/DsrF/DrsH-like family protein [Nitrospirota bacterium]
MAVNAEKDLDPKLKAYLNRYIDQRIVEASRQVYDAINKKITALDAKIEPLQQQTANTNRVAIIASKGTLDMAYAPLLIATGAQSVGLQAAIFFTFYGLNILKRNANLQVAPIANPAMPVAIPNIIGAMPGMTALATAMMKKMFNKQMVPTLGELLDTAKSSGVKLVACQMTLDAFGMKHEDLIDGVEFGGIATYLDFGMNAGVTLFI